MKKDAYESMKTRSALDRRDFLKIGGATGMGVVLGTPALWAQNQEKQVPPERIKTNFDDVKKRPGPSIPCPAPFPARLWKSTILTP